MEAGQWWLDDLRLVEAQKYTSTVTDRKNSWQGETQSYLHSYNSPPVILGQIMSHNDQDWSVFWNRRSSNRYSPPVQIQNSLKTGKHVGEDNDTDRANETVGFIVIEAGSGTFCSPAFETFSK